MKSGPSVESQSVELSKIFASWHPMLVHFPIALLYFALALDVWAFVAKEPELVANEIPTHVGVLWVSKGRAVVFRQAVRHPKGGMKSGQTAKLLLTSLI